MIKNILFKTKWGRPETQYIQPKSISLYFKKSTDKKYHFIPDLSCCEWINIEVCKREQNSGYDLHFIYINQSQEEVNVHLAHFNSEKDARKACMDVQSALNSPIKLMYKYIFAITAVVLFYVLMFGGGGGNYYGSELSGFEQESPARLSEDMEMLLRELDTVSSGAAAGGVNESQSIVVRPPTRPANPVDSFIGRLK